MNRPSRRALAIGLAALALPAAALAEDHAAVSLDGTWGGAAGQVTGQVIVTGGQVIGFYWDGDYTDATNVRFSSDGVRLSFDFAGGAATLALTGSGVASLEVRQPGKAPVRLTVRRD